MSKLNSNFYLYKQALNPQNFFGKRYIFFLQALNNLSQIKSPNSNALSPQSEIIQNFIGAIEDHFDSIRIVNNDTDEQIKFNNIMKDMLIFLEDLIRHERESELKYARQILENLPENIEEPEISNLIQALKNQLQILLGQKDGEFDYIQYIKLINELKKGTEDSLRDIKEFNQKIVNENTSIQQKIKKEKNSKKKKSGFMDEKILKYLYIFKRKYFNEFMNDIQETTSSKVLEDLALSINKLAAQLQEEMLKDNDMFGFNKKKNPNIPPQIEIIANNLIYAALNGQKVLTPDMFNHKEYIDYSNIFSKKIKNTLLSKAEKRTHELFSGLTKILYEEIDKELGNNRNEKAVLDYLKRTLKYIDNLNLVDDINKSSMNKRNMTIESIKTQIMNYEKALKKETTSNEMKAARKAAISNALKSYLDNEFKNELDVFIGEYLKDAMKEKAEEISEGSILLEKLLLRWVEANASSSQIIIADESAAEILAQEYFHSGPILKFLQNKHGYLPGIKISRKFDTTINIMPLNLNELIKKLETQNKSTKKNIEKLYKQSENFWENFVSRLNKSKLLNKIDINKTSSIFLDQLNDIGDTYQKLTGLVKNNDNDLKEIQKFLNKIQQTELSVKEYHYYYSKAGFEGGTLGSNKYQGSFIKGIDNIFDMYEVSGLTNINTQFNKELMIEAGLNCGPDLLLNNNSDVIKNIKEFLVTGAAMMMFETGFANTEAFIEKRKAAFRNELMGPNIVHFYHLNNTYIPASYVLQNIYDNLVPLIKNIHDTATRLTSENVSSSLYINNDINYYQDVFKKYNEKGMKRWEKVSKVSQRQTEMKFMFLAGIEDLLESLSKAFDPNT